ncbi:MAG TPA: hypothetical protein VHV57_06860 [Acidimicrobiales bacterium]|jgi:hypothetical protein|nr:hypothetical protein [Acidimicrobiales bacterium]
MAVRSAEHGFSIRPWALRRTRAAAVLGAGLALLAGVALGAPSAGASTKSAAKANAKATNNLVDDALYDALTSGFVHEVSTFSGQGETLKMVNDIGANEGQQTLVSGAAFGQVMVIGHQTFVRGNTQALVTLFSLSKSVGATDADQWILVPPSNRRYGDISGAVTLKSDFNQLPIPNRLTSGSPLERDGLRVIPVRGTIAATKHDTALHLTMYITASKNNPIPVGLTVTVDHTTQTVAWTQWGETPTLTAPTTTISLPANTSGSTNSATVTAV